jgi:hypothetical protein
MYHEILFSHKVKGNYAVYRKMDQLKVIMFSEINQVQKAKYHMFSLICGT